MANARRGRFEGSIKKRENEGRYEVRITSGIDFKTGKPKRLSFYAGSKTDATKLLQEKSYDIRINGHIDPTSVTVYQWLRFWLETYMSNCIKRSTYISYEGFIENHFKTPIGNLKLKDLTSKTLQELYNYKLEEDGLAPKTIINMNLCLHKALGQAEKDGYIKSNPSSAINLPRGQKPQIEVLSREQQGKLIRESFQHRLGICIRIALSTGMRAGELVGLQWKDIDLNLGTVTVQRTLNRLKAYDSSEKKTELVLDDPKSQNSMRTIPLLSGAVEDLKRWHNHLRKEMCAAGGDYLQNDLVFCNEIGGFIEPSLLANHYHRVLKGAGLPHFTFHALRHTFATRALEQGMDAKTLSVLLGHSSVTFTLDTYVHVLDNHKREAINLMEELYSAPTESAEIISYPVVLTPENAGYRLTSPDFPALNRYISSIDIEEIASFLRDECAAMVYPPVPTRNLSAQNGQMVMYISL